MHLLNFRALPGAAFRASASSRSAVTSSGAVSGQRRYASKDTEKAQPKILDESPPAAGDETKEVAEHNKDMEKRADKAHESVKDGDVEKDKERQKVGKGFWKGHGGVDKDS